MTDGNAIPRYRAETFMSWMSSASRSDQPVLGGNVPLLFTVTALHHSWTSATSGLRGLFLITCRQNFLRGLFLITCRQNFFVCEAPSGARPSAVADVADA
ncbi:hypothetical protein EVAR_103470_1 [Eumeta japonica]|uniref:Uncharacterized protein n=1 Tax=Eumeta variegata TaxID=151549 RepID=A0A4C1YUR3_EUMVA|nr:hypothetical protein EVAR_103470_1 [Eumeta japonica]